MWLQVRGFIRLKRNKPFSFIVNNIGMSLAFTALIILFTYALAFVIMLIIAVLSVSVLTWKAATANPVDSLRTE